MEQSILTSTKKVLHVAPDDDSFDLDIMTHINSAFSTLGDLGYGPDNGFVIEDDSPEWDDFVPEALDKGEHSQVKTFVLLSVRLGFDPPTTAFMLEATQKQLEEVTWRLNVRRENKNWTSPGANQNGVIST